MFEVSIIWISQHGLFFIYKHWFHNPTQSDKYSAVFQAVADSALSVTDDYRDASGEKKPEGAKEACHAER